MGTVNFFLHFLLKIDLLGFHRQLNCFMNNADAHLINAPLSRVLTCYKMLTNIQTILTGIVRSKKRHEILGKEIPHLQNVQLPSLFNLQSKLF